MLGDFNVDFNAEDKTEYNLMTQRLTARLMCQEPSPENLDPPCQASGPAETNRKGDWLDYVFVDEFYGQYYAQPDSGTLHVIEPQANPGCTDCGWDYYPDLSDHLALVARFRGFGCVPHPYRPDRCPMD